MAGKTADLLPILIERVEAEHPAPAIFAADEVAEWPDGALQKLMRIGLLQPAQRATTVVCHGCEWQCMKPVVVRNIKGRDACRGFVACDEEPDLGPISVLLERLAQYRSSLSAIARFLAHALAGSATPRPDGRAQIRVGSIKGRYGQRQISVSLNDSGLQLSVGRQHEPLTGLLYWDTAGPHVDRAKVLRLANRKEAAGTANRYQPDRSAQQKMKRERTAKDQRIIREALRRRRETGDSWSSIAQQIATTSLATRKSGLRISAGRIRRIVSEATNR